MRDNGNHTREWYLCVTRIMNSFAREFGVEQVCQQSDEVRYRYLLHVLVIDPCPDGGRTLGRSRPSDDRYCLSLVSYTQTHSRRNGQGSTHSSTSKIWEVYATWTRTMTR